MPIEPQVAIIPCQVIENQCGYAGLVGVALLANICWLEAVGAARHIQVLFVDNCAPARLQFALILIGVVCSRSGWLLPKALRLGWRIPTSEYFVKFSLKIWHP
jgi:hypothetical protein